MICVVGGVVHVLIVVVEVKGAVEVLLAEIR